MRFFVGLISVFVAGAACGGSSPTSSAGGTNTPPPGAPVVNVSMTDNNFSPPAPSVTVGTTVKWTNNGNTAHTTTSDATPPIWSSGTVSPSRTNTCDPADPYCQPGMTPPGTYVVMFSTPGTYSYHCQFHPEMTGTITVTP
jgi:plastocyanin